MSSALFLKNCVAYESGKNAISHVFFLYSGRKSLQSGQNWNIIKTMLGALLLYCRKAPNNTEKET